MVLRKGQAKSSEPGSKKGRLARLLAEHKLKETSVIGRFQFLTAGAYSGSNANVTLGYPLNKRWTGGNPGAEGAGNSMDLPVYAFNLSSMVFSQNSSSNSTCPFYRLNKSQQATAAVDATTWNYKWYKQQGQLSHTPTTLLYDWTLERQTGTQYLTNNHYFWKWSDIELGFKSIEAGAPRRVHIALVKFTNPATGPRREYFSGGGFTPWDGDVVDQKLCSESDLWYENWLARKVVHPLRRVEKYTTTQPIKFIKYQCICLEPSTTGQGVTFTQKIFHTANKLMSCVDPTLAEAQHLTDINTGPSGAFIPVKFNTNLTSASQAAFPAKHKDTWLMIWADDFEMPVQSGGPTYTPPLSFDLMIRSKFALTKM